MVISARKGQPILAEHINQFVRPAQATGPKKTGFPNLSQTPAIVIDAANAGASSLALFDVCLITSQAWSVADVPHNQGAIVPKVSIPVAGTNLDFIAVAQDQIEVGKMGRVCLSGVCWAKYDGSTGDRGAAVEGSGELTLSDTGPAEILATNSTAGLALVRFGGGGSGGSAAVPHSHTTQDWGFIPSWFGN